MKIASRGGVAVVTGAAGGLGTCFADELAERGHRLLLVDRRQQPLEQLCQSISDRHGVEAEPCVVDLCKREDVELLADRLHRMGDLELLINNAGFGTVDYFVDTDAKWVADMADVHVVAPMVLTRSALPGMIERNRGAIINVSSLSAWFHSAGNVHYGSTKCFLAVFSMSLHEELRGTNVRVQALCPGLVRTGFHEAETMHGFKRRCGLSERLWMSADEVVNCSLRSLSGKQVIVIPNFWYRTLGRLARMPVVQPLMQRIMRMPRFEPNIAPSCENLPSTSFAVAKSA
jgi:short-subunit dehydrogenase